MLIERVMLHAQTYKLQLTDRAVGSSFWLGGGGGGGLKLKFRSPSRALQVRGFIGEIF